MGRKAKISYEQKLNAVLDYERDYPKFRVKTLHKIRDSLALSGF